jgi:hypothetical protein
MLALCNQISLPTFRNNLLLIFYVLTLGSLQLYVKTMKKVHKVFIFQLFTGSQNFFTAVTIQKYIKKYPNAGAP